MPSSRFLMPSLSSVGSRAWRQGTSGSGADLRCGQLLKRVVVRSEFGAAPMSRGRPETKLCPSEPEVPRMARKQIVILGGGTGGTMTANRLRRRFDPDEAEIHVVDRDDRHVYQPGLLFVPFGLAHVDEIVRPRRRQLRGGVVFHEREVDSVVDRARRGHARRRRPCSRTTCSSSRRGVRLQPEETEGLTGAGLERAGVHVLHARGRRRAARRARALRRRPSGREPGRHADQVPGRAARVRVPRRLVPARARRARPHRARLRDAARRRLHQADRLRRTWPACSPTRRSSS